MGGRGGGGPRRGRGQLGGLGQQVANDPDGTNIQLTGSASAAFAEIVIADAGDSSFTPTPADLFARGIDGPAERVARMDRDFSQVASQLKRDFPLAFDQKLDIVVFEAKTVRASGKTPNAWASRDGQQVGFNLERMGTTGRGGHDDQPRKSPTQWSTSSGVFSDKTTVRHEMAHVAHFRAVEREGAALVTFSSNLSNYPRGFLRPGLTEPTGNAPLRQRVTSLARRHAKSTSEYARTNEREFMAESGAIYTHPSYKRGTLAKSVENLMDHVYKGTALGK